MGKLNLAIMDKNTRYMDSLAAYIMEHYRHRFSLQLFSELDAFLAHMHEHDSPASIYLVDSELCGEWSERQGAKLIIGLDGGMRHAPPRGAGAGQTGQTGQAGQMGQTGQHGRARFSVDRYKGADGIVADILKIYTARDGAIPDAELMQANRAGHAALVYSACGGAGRTTFAIGLCAHFAGMGQKTLYLNLDWTGVEPLAFDMASATGMTDVVFYLKTKPERLGSRLEALRQTNAGAAFDYFAPPDYPMDIDELAPAETELLVGKLRGSGMYDKIVIDTHCGLSMRNKALLDLADSVLILSEADALSLKKLSLAKQQLDRSFADLAPSIYKKCAIAINKCPRAGASGGAGARVDGAGSSYAGYTGYAGHTGADTGADSAGASCASAGAAHAGAALANAAHAGTGAGAGDLSEGWGADAGAGALLGHAREISRMFGTNVHIVPFCAGIDAGSLCAACSPAGSADGFGASVSSIARAIDSAGRGGAAYAKRGQ